MNIKAIVYTSNTGFTLRYAEMFAQKTGLTVYSLKEAKKHLSKTDKVIYFGWLMAGSIKDYKTAARSFDIAAVCGVGLSPTGATEEQVRNAISLDSAIPLFTVQGGMDHARLKGINRFMINMLIKMLSKKERTAEEDAMLKLIKAGGDYVSEDNLKAVLEWYNS